MQPAIPTRKNYEDFIADLKHRTASIQPDTCFYIYGSFNNANYEGCVFGISDIDGGFILNSGMVIPKNKVLQLSRVLSSCLKDNRVPTEFNLLDRQTAKDGRFLSYTSDFSEYLNTRARVLSGQNYIQDMKLLDYKSSVLSTAAANLRKIRNGLLYSYDDIENHPEEFKKNVSNSIDKTSKLHKKLLWLRTGNLVESKYGSLKGLKEIMPEADLTLTQKLLMILKDPYTFYWIKNDTERALEIYQDSVSAYESLLGSYVAKFPEISGLEAKL